MAAGRDAEKTDAMAPLIIDFGKKKTKDIKLLRKGEGKLRDELNHCVEELKTSGAISAHAQPVILVVREKKNMSSSLWPRM